MVTLGLRPLPLFCVNPLHLSSFFTPFFSPFFYGVDVPLSIHSDLVVYCGVDPKFIPTENPSRADKINLF